MVYLNFILTLTHGSFRISDSRGAIFLIISADSECSAAHIVCLRRRNICLSLNEHQHFSITLTASIWFILLKQVCFFLFIELTNLDILNIIKQFTCCMGRLSDHRLCRYCHNCNFSFARSGLSWLWRVLSNNFLFLNNQRSRRLHITPIIWNYNLYKWSL